MQDFRNLEVWKKAHELALDVQQTIGSTKRLDASVRSQITRSATSIPANIVEGCGKSSRAELARFSDIAIGSSAELEYWLLLTRDLGQLDKRDHERLTSSTVQVRKMLFGLRKAIRNGKKKDPAPAPAAQD